MVEENFQIYGAQITAKCLCESKIQYRNFYSCPILKFLSYTPETGKLLISPRQSFFRKSVSPSEMRGKKL